MLKEKLADKHGKLTGQFYSSSALTAALLGRLERIRLMLIFFIPSDLYSRTAKHQSNLLLVLGQD